MYLKNLKIMLLIVLTLTGCSFMDGEEEYQSPMEYATEQSEYIMECIVNKDKEGLKSVFSKHIAQTHDLDKEIDEFLEFIDGKIISYDEPTGYEGSYEMRAGEYYKKELGGDTKNIVTDAEKKYHIGFLLYQIYEKDEDYIGVDIIAITEVTDEVNGESVYIGY